MTPLLTVADLSISLGGREVVSGISFALARSEMLAVLGPNGSGKSSLVRCLVGLSRASGGSVRINGLESDSAGRRSIGYVPQIKTLDRSFPARAIELVASARNRSWPVRIGAEARGWSMEALERAGASHLAERQVPELSGGELQRVYLARALARQVDILILDEPESGIDAAGASDLHAQLDSFRQQTGGGIVLVTHDWDAAVHHATNVLLMKGRQISFGPPGEALSDAHVRTAFGHVGHAHAVKSAAQ